MQHLEFGIRIGTPLDRVVTWVGIGLGLLLIYLLTLRRYTFGLAREFLLCFTAVTSILS
jgi:hypothetical protein